jgi:4-hydroxythreonine-4-phosphate dehydrogenase
LSKIAISIGDINGIGIEIALRAHSKISRLCDPIYCINTPLLQQAAARLALPIAQDFTTDEVGESFMIKPGTINAQSGRFSYDSFTHATTLVQTKQADAIVTLPINKEAWALADIPHRGHTEAYETIFPDTNPIMMLGCDKLYVTLFTHHIPLREVPDAIQTPKLTQFLMDLYHATHEPQIGVLGLNPHAGDGGILGDEEHLISEAINSANRELEHSIFHGPLVPDTAFLNNRFRHFVCMYHDQGLIALKRLYFDESINATLNIPIIRTSVDHGTAFDIAYKNKKPSIKSYLNAIKTALELTKGAAKSTPHH